MSKLVEGVSETGGSVQGLACKYDVGQMVNRLRIFGVPGTGDSRRQYAKIHDRVLQKQMARFLWNGIDSNLRVIYYVYAQKDETFDGFRSALSTLFGQLRTIVTTEVAQLLPELGTVQTDASYVDWLDSILERTPDLVLIGPWRALGCFPAWTSVATTIRDQLQIILASDRSACSKVLEHPEARKAAVGARIAAKAFTKVLGFAKEHLPADGSLTGTVVGEGAGTELAGHPAKWPFVWAQSVFELIEQACTKYIELYDDCAVDAWRANVDTFLERIDQNTQPA